MQLISHVNCAAESHLARAPRPRQETVVILRRHPIAQASHDPGGYSESCACPPASNVRTMPYGKYASRS